MKTTGHDAVSLTAPDDKAFANLRAEFAMRGHQLCRSNPADGTVTYYSTRWGMVRHLANLDEARNFLIAIGGAA